MAKKKSTSPKTARGVKPPATKLKKAAASKPPSKKSSPAKKAATKSAKPANSSASSRDSAGAKSAGYVSLGRPKVTADEPLYLLFKEDYHARSVFEFLRVQTVQELEQFAAADIVARLTRPIHESVERIRQKLAEKNRYLSGDEQYLVRHRKQAQAQAERD